MKPYHVRHFSDPDRAEDYLAKEVQDGYVLEKFETFGTSNPRHRQIYLVTRYDPENAAVLAEVPDVLGELEERRQFDR